MDPSKILLDLLSAAQSPDSVYRTAAERQLGDAEKQPGFGLALVRVAVNPKLPVNSRQVAALVLKKFLKNHWTSESESFEVRSLHARISAAIRRKNVFANAKPNWEGGL